MIFDAPYPEAEDYPWAAMLRRALLAGLSSADFWAMSPAGVMAVSGGPLRPAATSPGGKGKGFLRHGSPFGGAGEQREPERVRLGSLTDCPF